MYVGKYILGILILLFLYTCGDPHKDYNQNFTLYVDETIKSMVDAQVFAYENLKNYQKVEIIHLPENQIFSKIISGEAQAVVVTRALHENERKLLLSKKIVSDSTLFGYDAVMVLANKKNPKKNMKISELKDIFVEGNHYMVFDNSGSSILRYMTNKLSIDLSDNKNVYAMKNTEEVVNYVCSNENAYGFIGLNGYTEPNKLLTECLEKNVSIAKLRADEFNDYPDTYFLPFQSEIFTKTYPLVRELIYIDCSGGVEMVRNFGTFLYGEIGQKIVQRSGLLPLKIAPRMINLKKKKVL